jgi:competence protein ComEC
MLATIGLLVAYAGVVGGGASVERATFMAVVYFGSRVADQRSPPLNTLALAVAALVIADPLAVSDPGFALTSGATLGILLSRPWASSPHPPEVDAGGGARRPRTRGPSGVIRNLFVTSLAVEALLFPVGALIFSRVTFAGLVLNFLAIPLMGVAQVAGMAVVALEPAAPLLAGRAGFIAYAAAEGLVRSADLVRYVPQMTWRVASPSWGVLALYYAAIGVGYALHRQRIRRTGSRESVRIGRVRQTSAIVAVLTACWILAVPSSWRLARGNGRLHVTFLDVGQGDSAFVRFPQGSTMLVDAGGLAGSSGFDVGDRVVAPVLRHAGLRRLDYFLLTHGDPDHIGGAKAVVREFRPRQVLEGIPVPRSASLTALRAEAAMSDARWVTVYRGWRAAVDGVEVVAVHPDPPDWERRTVRNDDSVVIDVRWRDVSVLLTGDIGRDIEKPLTQRVRRAPLTVLKVPHHGSRTSSSPALLEALRPELAIFSVGRSNRFGHPAPEVLARYAAVGSTILRTDRDGAVGIESNGYSMQVRTFNGREVRLSATTATHEGTKNTNGTER